MKNRQREAVQERLASRKRSESPPQGTGWPDSAMATNGKGEGLRFAKETRPGEREGLEKTNNLK